jgi:O-antigen/teichoic acid export membrane protein
VVGTVILPACSAAGTWLISGWVPGRPRRNCGVGKLVRYGGIVTLNSLVVYVAYNAEKVLLGRYWGAEALGIYGRAYQLVNMPTEGLKSAIGLVAFAALSRLQDQPDRFRNLFIRLYSAFLSIALPITAACALFAEDIILVFLGPKWHDVTGIFRLLSPTILAFSLVNPFGWLLFAIGRVGRSLKIALLIAPVTLLAFALGIGYGPQGVAVGFSTAMLVLVAPIILWAKHDTKITSRDVVWAVAHPTGSVLIGAALAILLWPWISLIQLPLLRLTVACSVMFGGHFIALLVVFRQAPVYARMLHQAGLWRSQGTAVRGE